MFRRGLFARMFIAFLAGTLAVACVFTFLIAQVMRQSEQEQFEQEVTMQAREVARLLENQGQITSIWMDNAVERMLTERIRRVNEEYHADIWLVSYSSGTVQYLDNNLNTSFGMFSDAVNEQLRRVSGGEEIIVQGLFPELGSGVVTIGVPWTYGDGRVVGAVLLHISVENLTVNYSGLIGRIWLPLVISVLFATLAAYLIARSQSRHIRKINSAVREFAKGELTSRVEVKTGDELQELAESFNKMAGELSRLEESRRSFVAAVSHELRSPLTCIRGYVQGMLDGTIEGEDKSRYMRVVMDETNRLTDLVRDLLDLSRLESGAFPMEKEAFDGCELVRRSIITYEKRIESRGCDVEVDMPDDPVFVMGDARRISQVVGNFIDNALKYGGENLAIKVAREDGFAAFSVRDDGDGIPEADLPHIFERFYKVDKAHTSGMGTGLGLSICGRIIEQHGSEISVRSGEGGTEFSFRLPLVES